MRLTIESSFLPSCVLSSEALSDTVLFAASETFTQDGGPVFFFLYMGHNAERAV